MQPKHDEAARRRTERDMPVEDSLGEEPDFEGEVSQATGKIDTPFDADLNPIDEEAAQVDNINTHGSDR